MSGWREAGSSYLHDTPLKEDSKVMREPAAGDDAYNFWMKSIAVALSKARRTRTICKATGKRRKSESRVMKQLVSIDRLPTSSLFVSAA